MKISTANTRGQEKKKERKWKFKVSFAVLCFEGSLYSPPSVCGPSYFLGLPFFPRDLASSYNGRFYALSLSFFFFPFTSLPLSLLRFSPVKARALSRTRNLEKEPQKSSVSFYLAVDAPSSCFFPHRPNQCLV